jgi:lipopolysaccharide/colanic/teichoic acid biosynthesis glycosyltransferase
MHSKVAANSQSSGLPPHRFSLSRLEQMSPWTTSRAKRIFDIAVVLASAPVVFPLLLLIALAVVTSSSGPVLFRQRRLGRFGEPFEIYKFRTMQHAAGSHRETIAAMSADQITPLGQILRWIKLDELPQVLNVLAGEMSLVGPRPRVPEQQLELLRCRPGVTGLATLAFAREESLFALVPKDTLPEYYRKIILPAKQRLDASYMKHATLFSDLKLIVDTALGRWGAYARFVPSHSLHIHVPERRPEIQSAALQ